MKHVTILVPKGNSNLSSITGTHEILTGANAYWRKQGNKSMLEITLASIVPELKLDAGFVTVHPIHIREIKKTDLLIIPSAPYSARLIRENEEMIGWIREQYLGGPKLRVCVPALFCWLLPVYWMAGCVQPTGAPKPVLNRCFLKLTSRLIN